MEKETTEDEEVPSTVATGQWPNLTNARGQVVEIVGRDEKISATRLAPAIGYRDRNAVYNLSMASHSIDTYWETL